MTLELQKHFIIGNIYRPSQDKPDSTETSRGVHGRLMLGFRNPYSDAAKRSKTPPKERA
jgi:hypothetical protein